VTKTGDQTGKRIGANLALSLILCCAASLAQADLHVEAKPDQAVIGLGDTLTVTVAVSSDKVVESQDPKVPNLDGLKLLNSWTSTSTSSKLMQGPRGMQFETVHRQEYNFSLSPSRTGNLQVGAFEVVVDGKVVKTQPFSIKVENGTRHAQRRQGRQDEDPNALPDPFSDQEELFQQLLKRRGPVAPPPANKLNAHNPNESFFVQLEMDKTSVYEGEQITANWYIYTRGNILALDRVKFPDLKGFWKEIIEEVPALNFQTEVINGVTYRKALLASHALFPIKAGTAVVDEYKIKATVQVPQGPFGFGPPYSFTRSSERVPFVVKPLPVDGKPTDFTGAVGAFDVHAGIEGNSFPANQPIALKVRFDGTGNAKNIELPNLNLPPGIEVYDTKNESKFFKNGHSFKEFEVLLIPRQVGDVTIPALSASMFNPANGHYYKKTTEPITLHITPGVQAPNQPQSPSLTSLSNPKSQPQLPGLVLSWNATWLHNSQLNWVLLGVGWLSVLILLTLKARRELRWGVRERTLQQKLIDRAKQISLLIDNNEWRRAGSEVSNLIYFVIGEIAGEKGGSQEFQRLLEQLPPSVRRAVGADLQRQCELFQVIGFAPEELVGKMKEPAQLKKEFSSVVKTLTQAISLS